ncbi:hypothetical protein [Deinococcus aquaedulcis]|uniref:hypothetical protein n=1 Tax=Deinococcus aquaedulcis TaxID=2840455 RepID=UPI001C835914|nr:hypothetical protein [Deinococcus aquaedulcis]
MKSEDLLRFQGNDVLQKLNLMYQDFRDDPKTVESFVDDPTDFIAKRVLLESQPNIIPQAVSRSNKFLFSVLSNERFREWVREYQDELNERFKDPINNNKSLGDILPREEVIKKFVEAMYEHGDKDILYNFVANIDISDKTESEAVVTHDVAVVTAIAVALIVVVTAIDITPRTSHILSNTMLSANDLRSLSEAMIKRVESLKGPDA